MATSDRLRDLDRKVLGPPRRVSERVRPIASGDQFVPQSVAARELGISEARVLGRILCDHLDGVQDEHGREGVSRDSLAKELRWQDEAGVIAKTRRKIWNVVQWVSF